MQRGLGNRIPLRGTRDEWDQLAENLNSMLERIEALMAEVKQVSDNVAHDLRTPLTRMRGRLEKAYNRQNNSDDDQLLMATSWRTSTLSCACSPRSRGYLKSRQAIEPRRFAS
jgi:signal transduction histidine kinase